jgi:hypothetical protein
VGLRQSQSPALTPRSVRSLLLPGGTKERSPSDPDAYCGIDDTSCACNAARVPLFSEAPTAQCHASQHRSEPYPIVMIGVGDPVRAGLVASYPIAAQLIAGGWMRRREFISLLGSGCDPALGRGLTSFNGQTTTPEKSSGREKSPPVFAAKRKAGFALKLLASISASFWSRVLATSVGPSGTSSAQS